jgi:hypothetical protein
MKVLEILGEAEVAKPKLDPNGNPLKTTDTIEEPKLGPDGKPLKITDPNAKPKLGPDGKPLKITDPNAKPKLGPDGKPLKITDPNQKPKSKSPATKNWQQKIFSEDAWMLLFHLGNKVDWGKERVDNTMISRLKRYYKSLILNPHFVTMESWQLDVQLESNLDIEGPYAEDVSSSLTRKVFAKLGITIGPSWKLDRVKPKADATADYIEFWEKHQMVMGAAAAPLASLVSKDGKTTDYQTGLIPNSGTPLGDDEAASIAAKIFVPSESSWLNSLKDWGPWSSGENEFNVLLAVRSIKYPDHFKEVDIHFKRQSKGPDLLSALKQMTMTDANRKTLDQHLQSLGLSGTNKKDPNNWTKRGRNELIKVYKVENNKTVIHEDFLNFQRELHEKFKEIYPDEYGWTGYGTKKKLSMVAIIDNKFFKSAAKEAEANGGELSVARLIRMWRKQSLRLILSSYKSNNKK